MKWHLEFLETKLCVVLVVHYYNLQELAYEKFGLLSSKSRSQWGFITSKKLTGLFAAKVGMVVIVSQSVVWKI